MPKAIVIGASSGLGLALATLLAQKGFEVGLIARRLELLQDLQNKLKVTTYVKQVDISRPSEAMANIESLIQEMQDVDLFIMNAAAVFNNPELDWGAEKATIEVNVLGFTSMVNVAVKYFLNRGRGHLVGISSIAAFRGESECPAYSASKAFAASYLEGLRIRMFLEKKNLCITDIKPGWMNTGMAKGEKTFWMISPEKAAKSIYSVIQKKRCHAYITSRWCLYALLLKIAPRWFYDRFYQYF